MNYRFDRIGLVQRFRAMRRADFQHININTEVLSCLI
jgi:hypothetical protein